MASKISKKTWVALLLLTIAGQMAWVVENNWFNTFVYSEITADPRPVSWMVTCSAIVSTIVTIIIGAVSDRTTGRWGRRKPFIFVGYILWGIVTMIFPSAAIFKPVALAAVVVVIFDAIMSGFGSVGNDAALNAYVADVTNDSNRGRVQGVLMTATWLAYLITAAAAGLVIERLGYFVFFYFLGGIVLLIGLVAGGPLLKETPVQRDESIKKVSLWKEIGQSFQLESLKENHELLIVFIVILVNGMAGQIFAPYLLIYFIYYLNFTATQAGYLQAAALLLGGILFSIPMGHLSDRWGRKKTGITLIIFQAVAMVIFALYAKTQLTAVILCSIMYIGVSGMWINTKSWTQDLYPPNKRGQFSGIYLVFQVLLPMITGPFIGSWLTTKYGISAIIDGEAGFIPTPILFLASAGASLLTLIPLFFTKEIRAITKKVPISK